jgi:hypothetical protein
VAAVGELETEYGDRVRFVVIEPEETARRAAEIEEYGLAEMRHGLVAFSASGEPLVKIPGHQFGKPEIVHAIDVVLAAP